MSDERPAEQATEGPAGSTTEVQTTVVERSAGIDPVYVVLGALAAIVVLALLWFAVVSPLLGGDEEAPPQVVAPTPAVSPPATPGAPTDDQPDLDEEVEVPVETFEVFLARDPFRPVRPPAPAAGPGGADGGPPPIPGDGATPPPGDGATPPPTDGTTPPPGDGATPPPGDGELPPTDGDGDREDRATVEGHEVELIDVVVEDGRRRAVVRVDDESYTVDPGETFAENFRLLSIEGSCATFLHGDNRFTLCEGDRVLK